MAKREFMEELNNVHVIVDNIENFLNINEKNKCHYWYQSEDEMCIICKNNIIKDIITNILHKNEKYGVISQDDTIWIKVVK